MKNEQLGQSLKTTLEQLSQWETEVTIIQRTIKAWDQTLFDALPQKIELVAADNINSDVLLDKITAQQHTTQLIITQQKKCQTEITSSFKKEIRSIVDQPEKANLLGAIATDIKYLSNNQLIKKSKQNILTLQDALDTVKSRIKTNEDKLSSMYSSFNRLLNEADEVLHAALRVRIPKNMLHYSNKPILKNQLKTTQKLHLLFSAEERKTLYLSHLKKITQNQTVDEDGYQLATTFLLNAYQKILPEKKDKGSDILNIKIIKPHDVEIDYIPVNKMVGSGGEGLTAGLLLYLVIANISAVRFGKGHAGTKGSFLLLDNPFSKANKIDLIRPQTELAKKLHIQLIFATGIEDLNAIGEFEHIIRLRKDRMDKNTNRQHIEIETQDKKIAVDLDKYKIENIEYSYNNHATT